jgi:hypothetical protein
MFIRSKAAVLLDWLHLGYKLISHTLQWACITTHAFICSIYQDWHTGHWALAALYHLMGSLEYNKGLKIVYS